MTEKDKKIAASMDYNPDYCRYEVRKMKDDGSVVVTAWIDLGSAMYDNALTQFSKRYSRLMQENWRRINHVRSKD